MNDEHEGTPQQASTGWHYVECSCGWRSARSLNSAEYSWSQHQAHQHNEAQWREIRDQIHGK